jgi:glycosyltransferase involved in cell wall biosynthesis
MKRGHPAVITPYLSIIIPARNEENRLPQTLAETTAFAAAQPWQTEIIIVENGSSDRTAEIAAEFAARQAAVTLLRDPLPGKGRAIRAGMLAARGEYRFMADADLSMPIGEIPRFLPPAIPDADVVIGSREAPGAVRYNEPQYRHLGGRLINTLIRLLILPGLHDTQCGFKCFRAAAAEHLFASQTLPGWSFDIELLFIARRRGCRIVELPIPWHYRAESKVRPVRDALHMLADMLRIHRNARRGLYNT